MNSRQKALNSFLDCVLSSGIVAAVESVTHSFLSYKITKCGLVIFFVCCFLQLFFFIDLDRRYLLVSL